MLRPEEQILQMTEGEMEMTNSEESLEHSGEPLRISTASRMRYTDPQGETLAAVEAAAAGEEEAAEDLVGAVLVFPRE